MLRPVIGEILDLRLHQRALVLDHDEALEPAREGGKADRLERPAHADLVDRDPEGARPRLVDAEEVEGLTQIAIGLAGGDEADPRPAGAEGEPVDAVGPREGPRRRDPDLADRDLVVEPVLEQHRPVDVGARARIEFLARSADGMAAERDVDDAGGIHRVGERDHRHPQSRESRHLETHQAIVDHVLEIGRIEDRDLTVGELKLGLAGDRGGLGEMIVAGDRQHAAVAGGAGGIGVFEHVRGPVDARRLAVPEAEHPVAIRSRPRADRLLRSPYGGRRQFLVDARREVHVVGGEVGRRRDQLLIVAGERRAAVAGDEAGGLQPRPPVEPDPVEG